NTEMNYLAPRFLIVHSPTKTSLNKFLQELKKNEVITIVGVCEATYNTTILEKEGIQILDWLFGDGGSPTSQIVDKWLKFVQQKFREAPGSCIAVHCATGLGRTKVSWAFNSKQLLYLEKYSPIMCLCFRNTRYNDFIQ
uniref:Tyrosine specific protein phosphatases domain-containing protein n=1 Tax=Rhinolophus ferrumequinum TaxID=59479 RepID=A0A671DNV0_RHIFE